MTLVFKGPMLHALDRTSELEIVDDAIIAVNQETGRITAITSCNQPDSVALLEQATEVVDLGRRILIPGLIDGHAHAPQQEFLGLGLDLPLMQWLFKYTFPCEARYADVNHAERLYPRIVHRHLSNGSTTVAYFATIHVEATKVLTQAAVAAGQRALIGKVSMDSDLMPEYYREEPGEAARAAQDYIQYVKQLPQACQEPPLIEPVVTPRFAPSCTRPLMLELARLARENQLPIQTHINESLNEVALVVDNSGQPTYADVYDEVGLLTDRTFLAHCIHCAGSERALIAARGSSVIHCPNSNFALGSGVCDVRQLWMDNVKVGLGTDVAGGTSYSMLDAMRQAIIASHAVAFAARGADPINSVPNRAQHYALSHDEAFYLATLGSAEALGIDSRVGNFVVGKQFDALVIDAWAPDTPLDVFEEDPTVRDVFERFFYNGDDRNIVRVYVDGKLVHQRLSSEAPHTLLATASLLPSPMPAQRQLPPERSCPTSPVPVSPVVVCNGTNGTAAVFADEDSSATVPDGVVGVGDVPVTMA